MAFVADGNLMVSRVVLLIMLAVCLDLNVLVEQPGSSLMQRHPRWRHMIEEGRVALFSLRFYMGAFGSASLKPTVVYSNSKLLLQKLERCTHSFRSKDFRSSVSTTSVKVDVAGSKMVTGLPTLKGTQSAAQLYRAQWRTCFDICEAEDLSTCLWAGTGWPADAEPGAGPAAERAGGWPAHAAGCCSG
jgi:hypothetical protein